MEINPNSSLSPLDKWARQKAISPAAPAQVSDFKQTDKLESALRDTPDVRPEAVARGRQLISDPNYPPPETIAKIARLLAEHWPAPNPDGGNG